MQQRNYSHFPRLKKHLPYLAFIILFAIFLFKADIIAPLKLSAFRSGRQISTRTDENDKFHEHLIVTENDRRAKILEGGETTPTLSLDKTSGSGFESEEEFLYGNIGMKIKLASADAGGTVSTYYMSSEGEQHDKIEIEFTGNSTGGDPYTIHTNVFVRGKGEREQRFFLWFDPARDFHNYTILWNPKCIIFYVDDIPIREFKNLENFGVPFPNAQPMRLYLSLGYSKGGGVETDPESAPSSTASYSNFSADACVWSRRTTTSSCDFSLKTWLDMELDVRNHVRMQRIQKSYKKYDYCWDNSRFPDGPGPECGIYY